MMSLEVIAVSDKIARIVSKKFCKDQAIIEAHMLLVYDYQALMKPPSQTGGRYEDSMRVWNLEPQARDMMNAAQRDLYDALMKLKPED